jgi:hypothetical protein
MATKKKPRAASVELIVRRGALRRFDKLKEKAAALGVKVSWDRRQGDRRTATDDVTKDRRRNDRRGAPPFTWDVGDFVVAAKTRRSKRR